MTAASTSWRGCGTDASGPDRVTFASGSIEAVVQAVREQQPAQVATGLGGPCVSAESGSTQQQRQLGRGLVGDVNAVSYSATETTNLHRVD